VNALVAEAQAHLEKGSQAEALDLLYTVLELAAGHRRDDPSLGQTIRTVLNEIETVEQTLFPEVALISLNTASSNPDGALNNETGKEEARKETSSLTANEDDKRVVPE